MTTEAEQQDGPAVTTKLRRTAFAQVCSERGLNTTAAIASAIGLSERQIERVIKENADPSARFIARCLANWPMLSFRSLFAVVDETTGEERR